MTVPPDAAVFLARLVHLDPQAVVRLRPAGPGRTALWAHLPWDVLVTRSVAGMSTEDITVSATELLVGGSFVRQDAAWVWALPPGDARVVESLPAAEVRRLGAAAAATLRSAAAGGVGGRPVGERVMRDALLDHVAIVVENTVENATDARIVVPQRLVQAVVRMGFLGPPAADEGAGGPAVHILLVGKFVGLAGEYGIAWYRKTLGLAVTAIGQTAEPH